MPLKTIARSTAAAVTLATVGAWAQGAKYPSPMVSRFWQNLDGLCTQADALRPATLKDAQLDTARAELLAYCEGTANPAQRIEPVFAANEEQLRLQILSELIRAAGTALPVAAVTSNARQVSTALSDFVASHAMAKAGLQGGAATALLTRELTEQICDKSAARHWLPLTCSALAPNAAPLVELQRRLLLDLLQLPQLAAAGTPGTTGSLRELRLVTAVAVGALDGVGIYEVVNRIAAAAPAAQPSEPLTVAAAVMRRLILDGQDLARSRDHYRRLIESELRKAGVLAADHALSTVQAIAGQQLLEELQNGLTLARKFAEHPPDRTDVQQLLISQLRSIEHAMTVATGKSYQLPPEGIRAIDHLLSGRPVQAAESLATLTPGASLSPELLRACRLGVDFLQAPDDEARHRVLRGVLLGIPPWTTPILLDVSIGTVALASNDFRFAGDLTLGYNAPAWGILGYGYAREYDLTSNVAVNETSEIGGRIEAWYAAAMGGPWRLEGRLSSAASLYDTQTTQGPVSVPFMEQTSTVLRGVLLAGLRYQKERFAAGVWLGGGAQYEWYDPLVVSTTVNLNTDETLRAKGEGRLRLQWDVMPGWFTARVRLDANAFRLTRAQTSTVVNVANGTVTESASKSLSSQLELASRVYLDVTVLALLGFVPNVNGGFDYVRVNNASVVEQKFLPLVGAGIRREVY